MADPDEDHPAVSPQADPLLSALFPTLLFPEPHAPEVFRLCLYSRPWRATLEPLGLSPAPPEAFLSPLELLERLEQVGSLPDGLR
ncbi:hypothetical protein [Deinococcus sp.]|uniref:hypothetical protein n=1 Tax=Deinococcus sp. TaxID=47478 RepID=UPI003CC5D0A2